MAKKNSSIKVFVPKRKTLDFEDQNGEILATLEIMQDETDITSKIIEAIEKAERMNKKQQSQSIDDIVIAGKALKEIKDYVKTVLGDDALMKIYGREDVGFTVIINLLSNIVSKLSEISEEEMTKDYE